MAPARRTSIGSPSKGWSVIDFRGSSLGICASIKGLEVLKIKALGSCFLLLGGLFWVAFWGENFWAKKLGLRCGHPKPVSLETLYVAAKFHTFVVKLCGGTADIDRAGGLSPGPLPVELPMQKLASPRPFPSGLASVITAVVGACAGAVPVPADAPAYPATVGQAIPAARVRRIVPFFEALDDAGYRALHERATKAARRGRLAGHVGRLGSHPDVPLPPMLPSEDVDVAVDAIADAWFAMATAKHEGASPRAAARKAQKRAAREAMRAKLGLAPLEAAPTSVDGAVSLTCAIARRLGQRREQHRLRRYRAGLTIATDRTVPSIDRASTIAALVAAVPPARRGAFERALAHADYRRAASYVPRAAIEEARA